MGVEGDARTAEIIIHTLLNHRTNPTHLHLLLRLAIFIPFVLERILQKCANYLYATIAIILHLKEDRVVVSASRDLTGTLQILFPRHLP